MTENDALISYRLKQADEALRTAGFLLENRRDIPAIANRMYYAGFYAILSLLVTKEIGTSKHSGVISAFDKEFVKTGIFDKKDSQIVHEAFEIRQEYDYREFVSYDIEAIQSLLTKIYHLISKIRRYHQDQG